ncbi:MAG: hypothetical protein NT069_19285, partial [Planctomycetota bacterium]|nr:hypothetical protein [Planctomycetota bacterium]
SVSSLSFTRLVVAAVCWGVALIAPTAQGDAPQGNSAAYVDNGEREFREGDYKGAIYSWKHALADDSDNGVLLLMYSQGLLATGQYNQSAGAAQRAIEILPEEHWGVVVENFRELYGRPQDYTPHLRALEKAVKDKPEDPALRFLAGYHYHFLGYPKQALDQLDKGLKKAPQDLVMRKLRERVAAKIKADEAKAEKAKPPADASKPIESTP